MSTSEVRIDTIPATDGSGSFAATVTLPPSGSGPGLILLQEIFGVNEYLRAVGQRLAALGYVSLAPDLFWRQEPGVDLPHDESAMGKGMGLAQGFDADKGSEDLGASLQFLRSLPEVTGGAGALGFCFGGTMAFLTAAAHDPDVAVSYYGSGVPSMLGMADAVTCPVLFHFGAADPFLPLEGAKAVEAAFAGREGCEVHIHEGAGHAFDNSFAPTFHQPEHAARAWDQTSAFLARHLPVSG
jgi:carboxymethylenebutenolidase